MYWEGENDPKTNRIHNAHGIWLRNDYPPTTNFLHQCPFPMTQLIHSVDPLLETLTDEMWSDPFSGVHTILPTITWYLHKLPSLCLSMNYIFNKGISQEPQRRWVFLHSVLSRLLTGSAISSPDFSIQSKSLKVNEGCTSSNGWMFIVSLNMHISNAIIDRGDVLLSK